MNYQSFRNLQFKRLLKTLYIAKQKLRDVTGEKNPFVSVGTTRVVLLFRKTSDNLFYWILHAK